MEGNDESKIVDRLRAQTRSQPPREPSITALHWRLGFTGGNVLGNREMRLQPLDRRDVPAGASKRSKSSLHALRV